MKKRIALLVSLTVLAVRGYAFDPGFAWSAGDLSGGFDKSLAPREDQHGGGFMITAFHFDFFDRDTGLGIMLSPFAYEYSEFNGSLFFILPARLNYRPLVFKLGAYASFSLGLYLRGGYGFSEDLMRRLPWDGLHGAAGAEILFATLPLGKRPLVNHGGEARRYYYMSLSLFAEYTSAHAFRVGFSADNFMLLFLWWGIASG